VQLIGQAAFLSEFYAGAEYDAITGAHGNRLHDGGLPLQIGRRQPVSPNMKAVIFHRDLQHLIHEIAIRL
jgi:hypothetical protein